ncbi:MAG: hypothetical protein GY702_25085 [Desulfobulbaceae bacterium]|nr:hypothetical protein [Desulfobulbaceae bacterium]
MEKKSMSVHRDTLVNEKGAVLVTAMLIMVVLTIIGSAAISVRNTETRIAKNSQIFLSNFYSVEAVALEGATAISDLDDATLLDSTAYPGWLKLEQGGLDLTQSAQWPSGLIIPTNTSLNAGATNITPGGYATDGTTAGDRVWYASTDLGQCSNSSLTDPTRRENCYDVYGMYDVKSGVGKSYHGRMMLLVGYKRVVYSN